MVSLRRGARRSRGSYQNDLGAAYGRGEGVEQSDEQAVAWYQKAAWQGLARAQYNLGTMNEDGDGVERDTAQALVWYRPAAAQGHEGARERIEDLTSGTVSSPDASSTPGRS